MEPRPEIIKKAINSFKRTENIQFFFENLKKPEWIRPLEREGLFSHPTQAIRKGTSISFVPWPQSQYLARMASFDPKLVVETILKIPKTDNIYIHLDFIEAALAMNPKEAVPLIKKEADYFKKQEFVYFSQGLKISELTKHLCDGGESKTALMFAEAVMDVLPSPKKKERRYYLVPRTKVELYEYEIILKECFPILVEAEPIPTFKMLLRFLDKAISFSEINRPPVRPLDYSHIWRREIEGEEPGSASDIKNPLISAVRDAGEKICESDSEAINDLVKILSSKIKGSKKPWMVNQRLILHLMRVSPSIPQKLLRKELLNNKNFDDPDTWHEYALLLNSKCEILKKIDLKKILKWIQIGPKISKKTIEEYGEDRVAHYKEGWTLRKMTPISSVLPSEVREIYSNLVKKFGDSPDYYYTTPRNRSFMGPTSPIDFNELKTMKVEELINALLSWKRDGEWIGDTQIGLGRELERVIASDPNKYTTQINDFKAFQEFPTYIRSVIAGFKTAVNQEIVIDWESLLYLLEWAVAQKRNTTDTEKETISAFDKDPHWGWTRSEIADLLSTGFNKKDKSPQEIPIKLKNRLWNVLKQISDDPDPLPEKEAKLLAENKMRAHELAINSTRGKAIQAVIKFGLWVKRQEGEQIKQPEVTALLENHLDISKDPAYSVRAVFGQCLPWLLVIDKDWLTSVREKIFPKDEALNMYCDVAWKSYVIFNQPYDEVFEIFKDQYQFQVSKIEKKFQLTNSSFNSYARLGEHLVSYFCRDKVTLKSGDLIDKYYKNLSDSYCAGLGSYIGRSLYDKNEKFDPAILKKMMNLWDWRNVTISTSPKEHKEELKTFGWWFSSDRFDSQWALKNLKFVLENIGEVDTYLYVMEEMDNLAKKYPEEIIDCWLFLVEGSGEDLPRHAWSRHIRTTVQTIQASSNPKAIEKMKIFVDKVGALKIVELSDLMN